MADQLAWRRGWEGGQVAWAPGVVFFEILLSLKTTLFLLRIYE